MRFDIFTLFPAMFTGVLEESILQRARAAGLIDVVVHNIRDYAPDKHHVTDDYAYGGGGGMVMKPEPIVAAVEGALGPREGERYPFPLILLSPQGRTFTQGMAQEFAAAPRLALICGHYEGVDERVRLALGADEVSVGDYVLTGGEIPAMAVVDAVSRLVPGVLGHPTAAQSDSHATGLLEHAHYTRPVEFRGLRVPEIVLSGHHGEVAKWRRRESLRRTLERRPELLDQVELTADEIRFLQELGWSGPGRHNQPG